MPAVLLVVVADQVARALPERRGIAQLLGNPSLAGMRRHTNLDHPPGANFYNDESVQRAKKQTGDLNKVTRPRRVGIIVDKGPPSLVRRSVSSDAFDVF